MRFVIIIALVACGGPDPEVWLPCNESCPSAVHIELLQDEQMNAWRRCDCPNGNEMIYRVVVPARTCVLDHEDWATVCPALH